MVMRKAARTERRPGPRRGSKLFVVDGVEWRYRQPVEDHGRWRVRRRHFETNRVEVLTLAAEKESEARAEVIAKAEEERKAAEEARKIPEDRKIQDATLGAVMDDWISTVDTRAVTRRDYESCIRIFKEKLGKDRLIAEVKLQDLEDLFFQRKDNPLSGTWAELKGQSKKKYLMLLKRIWKYAVKHGATRTNVPELVEPPKKWRDQIVQARRESGLALDIEQARALLLAAREPYKVNYTPEEKRAPDNVLIETTPPQWLWLFVFVTLRTGLRCSNVVPLNGKPGLLWRHVHLNEKVIRIEAELTKNNQPLEIPVHEELVDELEKLLKGRRKVPAGDSPIIPNTEGVNLSKALLSAGRRAGIQETISPHRLRHVFAGWVGERCTHIVTKRLLGHAAVDITDRYSKRQSMEAMRRGLNSLPRLLGTVKTLDVVAEGR